MESDFDFVTFYTSDEKFKINDRIVNYNIGDGVVELIVKRYGSIFKLCPERKAKWVIPLSKIQAFDVDPLPKGDKHKKGDRD